MSAIPPSAPSPASQGIQNFKVSESSDKKNYLVTVSGKTFSIQNLSVGSTDLIKGGKLTGTIEKVQAIIEILLAEASVQTMLNEPNLSSHKFTVASEQKNIAYEGKGITEGFRNTTLELTNKGLYNQIQNIANSNLCSAKPGSTAKAPTTPPGSKATHPIDKESLTIELKPHSPPSNGASALTSSSTLPTQDETDKKHSKSTLSSSVLSSGDASYPPDDFTLPEPPNPPVKKT